MLSGFRFNINRGIRVGGIMTIYHCAVIHCVLELGLWRQSYDIFAKWQREWGIYFEGGRSREMLNDRLYPINHVSKSQNLKISKWFY